MFLPRLCGPLVFAFMVPIGAAGAERLTDEQVKNLIQDIDLGYETWKKDLQKNYWDNAALTSRASRKYLDATYKELKRTLAELDLANN